MNKKDLIKYTIFLCFNSKVEKNETQTLRRMSKECDKKIVVYYPSNHSVHTISCIAQAYLFEECYEKGIDITNDYYNNWIWNHSTKSFL